MDLTVNTRIDEGACIGCGACIRVCPHGTLSLVDGKARVTGATSLNCGHCMAACPVGAVTVTSLQPLSAKTFAMNHAWLPFGTADTTGLVRLLASVRSCRNYADRPVARELLEDLVMIGTTAPSGSNKQDWTFIVLPDREQVRLLAGHTVEYFRRLNRITGIALLRKLLSLLGYRKAEEYYQRYHQAHEVRIAAWDRSGEDFVFYGAPCAILVGAANRLGCPQEDALLASQNIRLAAHAMGLGTCLIGRTVQALAAGRSVAGKLGLRADEKIYAVITVGWPDEKYASTIARKGVAPRYPLPGFTGAASGQTP